MISILKVMEKDNLASAERKLRLLKGLSAFKDYLPDNANSVYPCPLSRFVTHVPFIYWKKKYIDIALSAFEISPERTYQGINKYRRAIDIAFANILKKTAISKLERSLDLNNSNDLILLSTDFHAEYLRYTQHIYCNLLSLVWAVCKKKSVDGIFELKGAIAFFKSEKKEILLDGYDDRVRNAIAHGEIEFRGLGIRYGTPVANYELSTLDFLSLFDTICMNCHSISIALILFLARNPPRSSTFILPTNLILLFSMGLLERASLKINGAAESDFPLTGKQLHLSITSKYKSIYSQLIDACRIYFVFLNNNAEDFERAIISIETTCPIPSQIIIRCKQFANLIKANAPLSSLIEAIEKTSAILGKESKVKTKIKSITDIYFSHFRLAYREIFDNWQKNGLFLSKNRCMIREIKYCLKEYGMSVQLTAVLSNESDAEDPKMLISILNTIIKCYSIRRFKIRTEGLKPKIYWFVKPRYIWVNLYRYNEPLRGLHTGGFEKGNLLFTAEKLRGKKVEPISIKNPNIEINGIRIRYEIDRELLAEAIKSINSIKNEIWERKRKEDSFKKNLIK